MLVQKVRREATQEVLARLLEKGLVDRTRRIVETDDHVLIPLISDSPDMSHGGEIIEVEDSKLRKSGKPIQRIGDMLDLPEELISRIPHKWELLGNVLIFKLDPSLRSHSDEIAEVYAEVLHAKTVFEDVGGIRDEFREPELEKLWGKDAETVHIENGIRYKLDASRLMFSSGNKHERMRMASIDMAGETVLDMFAGIGYFTLPIAKYCSPSRVIACEKNPLAFRYLIENLRLNGLDNVKPVLKDCRDLELEEMVDRIVMGYLKGTSAYLPKALELIRNGGTIHYHEACPVELLPERPLERFRKGALNASREITAKNRRIVKSYAPKVAHVVIDIEVA